MPKSMGSTPKSIPAFLLRLHDNWSWRAIGRVTGIDKGNLSQIAHRKRRASDADIRAINSAYGQRFPLNPQLADVCPRHGVVHQTKRCPSDKPSRPRRDWKGTVKLLAGLWANGKLQVRP